MKWFLNLKTGTETKEEERRMQGRVGIRLKLLSAFLLLTVIPLVVLGLISSSQTSRQMQSQQEEALLNAAKSTAIAIQARLEGQLDLTKVVADKNVMRQFADQVNKEGSAASGAQWELVVKELSRLVENAGGTLENALFVSPQGQVIADGIGGSSIGTSVADREYFLQAVKGEATVGDVVRSKLTGEPVVVCAAPVMLSKGEVGAVVALVQKFSILSKYAAELKAGETGYAFMIDKKGVVVYHPTQEKVLEENLITGQNTELADLARKMAAGKAGYGFYTYEGVRKFCGYAPAGNWSLALTVPVAEYMRAAAAIKKTTVIVVAVFLLFAILVAFAISGQIARAVSQLVEAMERAKEGDLTARVNIKSGDELGQLGNSFNYMLAGQQEIVKRILNSAQDVAAAAQELSAAVEEGNAAMEEITATVNQVAAGMQNNAAATEETNAAVEEVASNTQNVAHSCREAADQGEQARERAQEGAQAVEDAINSINEINSSAAEVAQAIQELDEVSKQISMIVQTITAISEQTNLLALNAAIEAARAGEQGRGFAVVAEEVRKLAEGSNTAASEIGKLIGSIQSKTARAVEKMAYGSQVVSQGMKLAGTAREHLNEILQSVNKTGKLIAEIAAATEELSASVQQIAGAMNNISSTTSEVSKSA
ncbi:MAG: methyl-accepting chemotaxis protein [Firmicutes bacterium]|nr:methyl-accepting chemotaxis protein [Bacillota bacterium]